MTQLDFQITGAEAVPFAVSPTIAFKLRVANADRTQTIHNVLLRCQIQIDATRRIYNSEEKEQLSELFGEPHRWRQTVRSLLWQHVSQSVPSFAGETVVDLLVPCTFDFNVAATKYFAGLTNGEVPLVFLFSGTIFYEDEFDGMQVMQIPWEQESAYRLPVAVWQKMMEFYYPNQSWLTLRRDVFDRLQEFKRTNLLATLEQTLEQLLDRRGGTPWPPPRDIPSRGEFDAGAPTEGRPYGD